VKTPLAIFAYRRREHLARCLAAVERCAGLDACAVTIFCDGPRAEAEQAGIEEVRQLARTWARDHAADVREAPRNLGLARSIVSGVTELCTAHGRAIVLEDDLEPAPEFLRYMLAALHRYEPEPSVMQVAGYRLPFQWEGKTDALFLPCTTTWGWATWQRAWERFRWKPEDAGTLDDPAVAAAFDLGGAYPYSQMLRNRLAGRNDSWGILWWWAVFRAGGLVLYPRESLVTVGGVDGTGTHCGADDLLTAQMPGAFPHSGARLPGTMTVDPAALAALRSVLRKLSAARHTSQPWWRRVFAPLSAR
jgi:GT2 family glycosyltransferase